jgi:multiple sugar transport system permease protein
MMNRKEWRRLAIGIQFLAPNILGFATFTMLPVVFSIVMACSNYNLIRYNRFHHSSLTFPTMQNFLRLWGDGDFWRYLGNTFFFLLAVPVGIAASLLAALALNVSPGAGRRGVKVGMIATAVFVTGVAVLLLAGAGASGIVCLLVLLPCGLFMLGTLGGSNAYRTLFYIPSFTSGVAIFIVWAKLYNPNTGPINSALAPVLRLLSAVVMGLPAFVPQMGYWICMGLMGI